MNSDGSNQRKILDTGENAKFGQANGTQVGGDLFSNVDVSLELDPGGDYQAAVTASDSVNGIARYELLTDSNDGNGQVLQDSVDLDCSSGCPKNAPTKNLTLNAASIPNDETDVEVRAVDGAGHIARVRRKVHKLKYLGITEPRLGRTDAAKYPVFGDLRFDQLAPHFYRLLVPWERLEPSPGEIKWDADVGGGVDSSDARWDKSNLDEQITRAQNMGMQVLITFYKTPCWAIIPQAVKTNISNGTQLDPCGNNSDGHFPDNNSASWPDPDPNHKSFTGQPVNVLDEYKNFVAQFAKRYSAPGHVSPQPIRFYTAWNEPNYFSQSQPQYCKQKAKLPKPRDKVYYPDFNKIPCPAGRTKLYDRTADLYYTNLYSRLYQAIRLDDIPGLPGSKFDASVKVIPGETSDTYSKSRSAADTDEASFAKATIQTMQTQTPKPCGNVPWTTHAYQDIKLHTYERLQRLRRVLDGLDPDTGTKSFDSSGCTLHKQIWVTEGAGMFKKFMSPPPKKTLPKLDRYAPCLLFDFIDSQNQAPDVDKRRVDVFTQYLYQTDVDSADPAKGFNSGLLWFDDKYPQDQLLDQRLTYDILYDWSQFLQHKRSRPARDDYKQGTKYDCDWGSLGS